MYWVYTMLVGRLARPIQVWNRTLSLLDHHAIDFSGLFNLVGQSFDIVDEHDASVGKGKKAKPRWILWLEHQYLPSSMGRSLASPHISFTKDNDSSLTD